MIHGSQSPLLVTAGKRSDMTTRWPGWPAGLRTSRVPANTSCSTQTPNSRSNLPSFLLMIFFLHPPPLACYFPKHVNLYLPPLVNRLVVMTFSCSAGRWLIKIEQWAKCFLRHCAFHPVPHATCFILSFVSLHSLPFSHTIKSGCKSNQFHHYSITHMSQ